MENKKLQITTETIHSIDYDNLEEFVQEVYGAYDYSFVATQECGNDSTHRFKINSKEEGKNYLPSDRSNISSNYVLFKCLVFDGYLEPGIYVVNVCW